MIDWKGAISYEMAPTMIRGNVESCALTEHGLSVMFDDGYGPVNLIGG